MLHALGDYYTPCPAEGSLALSAPMEFFEGMDQIIKVTLHF